MNTANKQQMKVKREEELKTAAYPAARAYAQQRANELGFDQGLEWNPVFKSFSSFMLPGKKYRQGHELRVEVVMCERLESCQPGHGPLAKG